MTTRAAAPRMARKSTPVGPIWEVIGVFCVLVFRGGGGGGGGGGDVVFWGRGGGIAAVGWLVATGLNAGVGVLCGERERQESIW